MATITYNAVDRGSLLSGHTEGTHYTIEFGAQSIERSIKRDNARSTALGGRVETLRNRKEIHWNIGTDHIEHADLPVWYEFMDSVDAGEAFKLDPYGTAATPDAPRDVILEGNPTESRVGAIKVYTIRFRVREIL